MKAKRGDIVRHGRPIRELIVTDVSKRTQALQVYPLKKADTAQMACTYWSNAKEFEKQTKRGWKAVTGVKGESRKDTRRYNENPM